MSGLSRRVTARRLTSALCGETSPPSDGRTLAWVAHAVSSIERHVIATIGDPCSVSDLEAGHAAQIRSNNPTTRYDGGPPRAKTDQQAQCRDSRGLVCGKGSGHLRNRSSEGMFAEGRVDHLYSRVELTASRASRPYLARLLRFCGAYHSAHCAGGSSAGGSALGTVRRTRTTSSASLVMTSSRSRNGWHGSLGCCNGARCSVRSSSLTSDPRGSSRRCGSESATVEHLRGRMLVHSRHGCSR